MVTVKITLGDKEKNLQELFEYVDLTPSYTVENMSFKHDNEGFMPKNIVHYEEVILDDEYDNKDKNRSLLLTEKIINIVSKIDNNTPTLHVNEIEIIFHTDYYFKLFLIRPVLFKRLLDYSTFWEVTIRFGTEIDDFDYSINNQRHQYKTLKDIFFINTNFCVKDKIVKNEKKSAYVIKKRLKEFHPMMAAGDIIIEEISSSDTFYSIVVDEELSKMLIDVDCRLVFLLKKTHRQNWSDYFKFKTR